MSPIFAIIAGSFGLGLVVAYAMWVKVRVWIYRQDLFSIRDGLWDAMRARGHLDLVEHRDIRDGINSLIRLAPFLSVWTMAQLILSRDEFRPLLVETGDDPELETAKQATLSRTVVFLLYHTISGRLMLAAARLFGFADSFVKRTQQRLGWLFDSKEFQAIDLGLSAREHMAAV